MKYLKTFEKVETFTIKDFLNKYEEFSNSTIRYIFFFLNTIERNAPDIVKNSKKYNL